jgi:Tfp pilus assembly protein PilX
MGARINYVFKDGRDSSVVLYSHWGQSEWQTDIAGALQHAKPRWGDSQYGTRMMISYLIKDSLMDETGFGIYSIAEGSYDLGDQTVVIDFVDKTVTDNVSVNWDNFVKAYGRDLVNA